MYKYCVSAFPLVCNLFHELFGEEYKANIKQKENICNIVPGKMTFAYYPMPTPISPL